MAPSNITDRLEPNSKWIKRLPNKAIRILPNGNQYIRAKYAFNRTHIDA